MGKRFMANLHTSLDSTCKSRISKISTICQIMGVHSTTFDPELRNEFKNPPAVRSWGVHSTTFDPELRNEFKKKIPPDVRSWGVHSMEWAYSQDLILFPVLLCTAP